MPTGIHGLRHCDRLPRLRGRSTPVVAATATILAIMIVAGGAAGAVATSDVRRQSGSISVSARDASMQLIHDAGHAFIAVSGAEADRVFRIADAGKGYVAPTGSRVVKAGANVFAVDYDAGRVSEVALDAPTSQRRWEFKPSIDVRTGADGSLVVLEVSTAAVSVVAESAPVSPMPVGTPGDSVVLSSVGDEVVVTNTTTDTTFAVQSDRTVREIDLGSWPAEEIVSQTASGSRLAIMRRADGEANLVIADIATGTTRRIEIAADLPRDPQLLVTDAAVFVPEPRAGRVRVIDVGSGASEHVDVDIGQEPGRFELFLRGDELWLNNPADDQAVVLGSDGDIAIVEKSHPVASDATIPTHPPESHAGDDAELPRTSDGEPAQDTRPSPAVVDAENPTIETLAPRQSVAPPESSVAAPGAPDAPHADVGLDDGSVTLAWNEPDLAGLSLHHYRVDVHSVTDDDVGGVLASFDTHTTSLQIPADALDLDPDDDPDYAFTVTTLAADPERMAESRRSDPSEPIDVYRRPETSPSVSATSDDGRIVVSWEAPPESGRRVRYEVANLATGETATNIRDTTTTWSGLENGRTYGFEVTATNAAGSSAPRRVSAAPSGVPTLAVATVTQAEREVSATFAVTSWGGGPGGCQFRIGDVSTAGLGKWQDTGCSDVTAAGLSPDTTYNLEIRATNGRRRVAETSVRVRTASEAPGTSEPAPAAAAGVGFIIAGLGVLGLAVPAGIVFARPRTDTQGAIR